MIDSDGEILLTNRSRREFGPDEYRTDHVGVNYIATARMGDDEHARRAVDGLEAVIAGERDTFAMEYPCHSPDRKQWYEWPRNVSGEDLARSMDISRSTFHQHLRSAQRKLLDELFDGDPLSKG